MPLSSSEEHEATRAFAARRHDLCAREQLRLPLQVEVVSPVDLKETLPPPHPTMTRQDISEAVARTTGQALHTAGFGQRRGRVPGVDAIRHLAKEGAFEGIGAIFTDATEIARLWHAKTAYSPLALAPQYGSEDVLPVPRLRSDGSAPRAGEPDRQFGTYMPVPKDDPARASWRYHPDTVAVRRRGEHLKNAILDYCLGSASLRTQVRIAAIAGGAAWPDIRAVAALAALRPDLKVGLDVFDWDAAAVKLGVDDAQQSLGSLSREVRVTTHDGGRVASVLAGHNVEIRFINADITNHAAVLKHARHNGQAGYDLVEAAGLIEYLPADAASFVISGMDGSLSPSGRGIVANMTCYHDYVQILGVIGWRALRPRSMQEVLSIVDAGVARDHPSRQPVKRAALLADHSYLFVSWDKQHAA